MVYNSHATGQDICTLADKLVKTDSTSFPIAEKTVYANMGNRLILTELFNAYGGWKYDDRNNTDFPISTTALTANQTNYSLPVDVSSVQGVYYLAEGTTDNWTKLTPITVEQINEIDAEPNFQNIASVPQYYRLLNNSIKIYPASNYTLSGGLMVEYTRDISEFATTDTTKTPGFEPIFHEAIAVYMAYRYAQANSLTSLNGITQQWTDYLSRIKRHYTQKFGEMFPPKFANNTRLCDYL